MRLRTLACLSLIGGACALAASGFPRLIGLTASQADVSLPGDLLLPGANVVVDRGVAIDAPASVVWDVLGRAFEPEDESTIVDVEDEDHVLMRVAAPGAPEGAPASGTCVIALLPLSPSRTLLHIQDYEVDAMLGLGMAGKSKGGKVAKLASAFERSGLHNVDYVSTISRSMMNKAQEKGVPAEKVIFFPNWSEVARFRDVTEQDAQALRAQLGLPEDQKIILYSGNIGEKQGLESVIEAAQLLNEHPWMFVIVGQGGGKARLEKMVSVRGLTNVKFFPLQSYEALPALLKMGDCHLVVQKRGAADAVLPSKLTNILAVGGNAVITAEAETELGQLCDSYPGIAVCVEPESVPALVTGIEQALAMPKVNTVAREYAERTLEKENVLSQFIADIRG